MGCNVFVLWGQNGALGTKKRPFLAQIGYAKKWIFLKNIIFKFVKIAQKVPFWVNNDVRKRWARSLDKKIFRVAKLRFLVLLSTSTGRNRPVPPKTPQEGPSGLKTVPTSIIHDYM